MGLHFALLDLNTALLKTKPMKPPTKQAKRAVSKIRRNISITPTISKQAEKVAAKSGLSFSSWNETLIRRELAK
jgi:hypothetical protein